MSLEDIFKVLADSRQQGASASTGASDPMTQLIGGLLGGQGDSSQTAGQVMDLVGGLLGGDSSAPAAQTSGSQGADLSSMMDLLETVMSSGQSGATTANANDPLMSMLQPFINQLAEKVHISPAIATLVVSFVVHKMLAHHPSSGRDSNQFSLDDLLSTGAVSADTLKSSGMVRELAKVTGLNEQTASHSLDAAFSLLGGTAQQAAGTPTVHKSAKK